MLRLKPRGCFFTALLFLRQMALLRFFLPPYAAAWFEPTSVQFLQTGSFEERSSDWATVLRQELAVFGAQLNPAQQKMLVMTLLSAIVKLLGNINNLKGINDSKINSNLSRDVQNHLRMFLRTLNLANNFKCQYPFKIPDLTISRITQRLYLFSERYRKRTSASYH